MLPGVSASAASSPIPEPKTLREDLTRRAIKIVDIGYVTAIYFVIAFFLSVSIDRFFGPFDREAAEKKSLGRLIGECILHLYMVAVIIYFARNTVDKIPFPLDGVAGFMHSKLKELTNAAVFTFVFLYFQKHLRDKMLYAGERWGKGTKSI